jgi:hypothetical protein
MLTLAAPSANKNTMVSCCGEDILRSHLPLDDTESIVRIHKSPYDSIDHGRAWVVEVINERAQQNYIVKIYSSSDRDYFENEANILRCYINNQSYRFRIPKFIYTRAIDTGFLLSYEMLPGKPLSSIDDIYFKCNAICRMIQRLSLLNLPASKNFQRLYSKNQKLWFFSTSNITIACPRIFYHHQECFANFFDCSELNADLNLLREWSHCFSRHLRHILLTGCVTTHSDLNSDNIIVSQKYDHGIIDVGLTIHTTPLLEWGGAVAHLGTDSWDCVLHYAFDYMRKNHINIPVHILEILVAIFAIRRAIRRISYLSRLSKTNDEITGYIKDNINKQLDLIFEISFFLER